MSQQLCKTCGKILCPPLMSHDDNEFPEGALILEPRSTYDKAIVGYTSEALVYDAEAVIEAGIEIYDTYDDSLEWHNYNTFGTYMGDGTPIFMHTIEKTTNA